MRLAHLAAAGLAALSLGFATPALADSATALDASALDRVTAGFTPAVVAVALPPGRVAVNPNGVSVRTQQRGTNASTTAGAISTLPVGDVLVVSDAQAGTATRSGRTRSTAYVSVSPGGASEPTLIVLSTTSNATGPGATTSQGVEFAPGASGFDTISNVGLTIGSGAASSSFRTVVLSVPPS